MDGLIMTDMMSPCRMETYLREANRQMYKMVTKLTIITLKNAHNNLTIIYLNSDYKH